MARTLLAALPLGALLWVGLPLPSPPSPSYLIYVAAESDDQVALVRFTPEAGFTVEKTIPVGWWDQEIEAPHGVTVDPSGAAWYLTLGHGFPFGSLVKYRTGVDTAVGVATLGLFPATVAIAPAGGMAIVVNADFHGDKVASDLSIIDLETMLEIARPETCTMPHGSRFSPDGSRHYSVCMVDDQLVELDVDRLEVARRLPLTLADAPAISAEGAHCMPTWVIPNAAGSALYVACNMGNQILEVDVAAWRIARRLAAAGRPYNLALTHDGARLLATLKGQGAVGVWDVATGQRLAVIESTRRVTHGVIVTPDDRYAFVSVEGIGGEPGTVDAIDLELLEKVASVDIGKQAGGIAFWKVADPPVE